MSKEQPIMSKEQSKSPPMVTIKEAAENEKKRQDKLSELRKRTGKISGKLKSDGYEFELEETSDEYIITKDGIETHLLKSEDYGLEVKDKPRIKDATLEEMIAAAVVNPKGSTYDTVVGLRSQAEKK